jgi:hypothetical protein
MRGVGWFGLVTSSIQLHDGPAGQIQTLVNKFRRIIIV